MTAVELKAHACMPEKIGAPALTKTELTNLLFDKIGLNKGEAKKMVDAFFNEISDALEKGEAVKLSGFGNFELRDKSERPGRNPKTGEKVTRPDEQGRDWNDYAQRTARYAFGGAGDRQAADLGKYRQQWEKLEGREQKPQIDIAQPKKEVVIEVKRDRGPSMGR